MRDEGSITRRRFLDRILAAAGVSAAGLAVYPILRFVIPPKQAEANNLSKTVLEIGALGKGDFKIFEFNRKAAILIRTGNDPASPASYHSLSAVCTHLGCIVQYDREIGHIWCACHNGHFSLTGKVLSGPPPSPLPVYDVEILNDKIIVSRGSA